MGIRSVISSANNNTFQSNVLELMKQKGKKIKLIYHHIPGGATTAVGDMYLFFIELVVQTRTFGHKVLKLYTQLNFRVSISGLLSLQLIDTLKLSLTQQLTFG